MYLWEKSEEQSPSVLHSLEFSQAFMRRAKNEKEVD